MSINYPKRNLLNISILVIITIIVYANSLSNDFVYDDRSLITDNYLFRYHFTAKTFFNSDYFKYTGELSYRPLCTLSFLVDYLLWGLNPVGYHIQSLLWHILNVVLVYIFALNLINVAVAFMRQSCGKTGILPVLRTDKDVYPTNINHRLTAFFGALLFAVHPINVEAVTPITFREDPMFTAFYLISFIAYLKLLDNLKSSEEISFSKEDGFDKSNPYKVWRLKRAFLLAIGLVSFFLSLLAKEMAGTLIILIVVYDWIIRKRKIKKEVKYYSLFFVVLFIYLTIRFVLLKNPAEERIMPPGGSYLQNVFITPFIVVRYIALLFFPIRLSAEYTFDFSNGFPVTITLLSVVGLIFILLILFFFKKKEPIITFSGLLFFITLLPVMNIIPTSNLMAERFLYLPSIGFCLLISYIIICRGRIYASPTLPQSSREFRLRNIKLIFLIAIILVCSFLTIKRNSVWKDDFALWNDTVQKATHSPRAHFGLGRALEERSEVDKAIGEYKKAIELYPLYYFVYNNLGVVYMKNGEIENAINCFNKAIEIKKDYAQPYGNLGKIYYTKDKFDLAEKYLKKAIGYDKQFSLAYNNLALVYLAKNNFSEALTNSLRAVELESNNLAFRNNLATVYKGMKDFDKAEKELRYILEKNPNFYGANLNLGLIYAEKGDEIRAESYLKKAIEIDDINWQGHFNLGILYAREKEYDKALLELKRAYELNPKSELIKENLLRVEKLIKESKVGRKTN